MHQREVRNRLKKSLLSSFLGTVLFFLGAFAGLPQENKVRAAYSAMSGSMDREEYDWLAGMIDLMGENKATAFFERLVKEQGVKFKRGHALITQLVAAGEHDLLIDGYVHSAVQLKTKGAPINFVFMNPTVVKPPSGIGIASRAPHPYSAALLADYHLSKEGQEFLAQKQFYWTSRRDVKWATEPGTELRVVSPLEWGGGKYNYVSELFRKIIGD